jgi:hypothetical protein
VAGRGRIRVRGLRETIRAFDQVGDELPDATREALKHAAEPVRVVAERRALSEISGLPRSPKWAEQKITVSKRTALVYMSPRKRQTRVPERKRKNLAELLMGKAMEPALEDNRERVIESVDKVIDLLGRKHGF